MWTVAKGEEKVLSVHISCILCNVLLSAWCIGGPLLQHSDKIYTNAPATSLGHKWWWTDLEIENPSQAMRGGNLHPRGPIFFLPKGGGGGDSFGIRCSQIYSIWFLMFPPSSQMVNYYVPNSSTFYAVRFAQSPL
jgi:hypothetical protein